MYSAGSARVHSTPLEWLVSVLTDLSASSGPRAGVVQARGRGGGAGARRLTRCLTISPTRTRRTLSRRRTRSSRPRAKPKTPLPSWTRVQSMTLMWNQTVGHGHKNSSVTRNTNPSSPLTFFFFFCPLPGFCASLILKTTTRNRPSPVWSSIGRPVTTRRPFLSSPSSATWMTPTWTWTTTAWDRWAPKPWP